MTNSQDMINSIIIIVTFAAIILYAYISSAYQNRKRRMRRWEKQKKEMQARENDNEALNINSLYEEAAGKGKLQKGFKWELHETI